MGLTREAIAVHALRVRCRWDDPPPSDGPDVADPLAKVRA
jgi:hypothetical protein